MGAKTDTSTKTQKSEQAKKQRLKLKMSVMPNAGYRAKGVYIVNGLGIYDGKYVAEKVIHTVNSSSGYTVDIEAYRESPTTSKAGQSTGQKDTTNTGQNNSTRNNRTPLKVVTVSEKDGKTKNETLKGKGGT